MMIIIIIMMIIILIILIVRRVSFPLKKNGKNRCSIEIAQGK